MNNERITGTNLTASGHAQIASPFKKNETKKSRLYICQCRVCAEVIINLLDFHFNMSE